MSALHVRSATLLAGIALLAAACGGGDSSAPASDPVVEPVAAETPNASVWLTTADETSLLAVQAPIAFTPEAQTTLNPITVDVDDTKRFQTMVGFGASLTDSSAWLIGTRMSAEQRTALMRALFDPQAGIGLSALRHVVGASDFALSNYTFNDLPEGETDPELQRFSIDHDRQYILPVLQEALALNPQLSIIGTPWTAPAWMKSSHSLIGGSLLPENYGVYANYLVRYIQAFAAEGVPISAITPVNEPLFEPPYPGMLMDARQQADFVKNNLGPALTQAQLTTQIIIYDHNWDRVDYPTDVLNDADARGYVTGTAFHCYAGSVDAQNVLHDLHPDKTILLTECTGLVGSPFERDLRWAMRNLFVGATRRWATHVMAWNLALDGNSGPQNGGCAACRGVVTIEQSTGAVTYNVEYYALGHASIAARPGATRIESTTFAGNIESVAFLNPDQSKGVIVFNDGAFPQAFSIRWSGLALSYTLPPGAVATFKWP